MKTKNKSRIDAEEKRKKLAEKIACDLFTCGIGQKAHRLVMFNENGIRLAGWSERGAADRIELLLPLSAPLDTLC